MNKADLKRSLEAELLKIERQENKIYGVGETRYDLMIKDVLNYIDNSISKKVIKEKIEENRKKYLTKGEDIQNMSGATFNYYQGKVDILQELLEGK